MSLVEVVSGINAGRPICCFEIKGPNLDLTSPAIKALLQMTTKANSSGVSTGMMEFDGVLHQNIRGKCKHEVTADGMCLYFNYLFSNRLHYDTTVVGNVTKRIMMPIAQTVVQALITLTGYAFLFTHELGIAVEVDTIDESGRILIRTSRLFCSNMQKDSLSAATALGEYSIRKHQSDKGSVAKVKRVVAQLLNFVDDAERRTGLVPEPDLPSSDGETPVDYLNHGASTTTVGRDLSAGGSLGSNAVPPIKVDGLEDVDRIMEESFMLPEDTDSIGSSITHEQEREEAILSSLDEQKEEFVAEGASGMIMSVDRNGYRLVIKGWNGNGFEGLSSLRREISVYKFIELHAPFLFGSSVPSLFLGIDEMNESQRTET